ncbi:hypothetical protein PF005_g983 [Phytophthora fragariae]|uniref:Chromo domain-containing protein n=1 Tax=Phytophthora fragariae TaxID=53985 RepID=A0A6A3FKY3_9STRA|nr:hypothetical protein PF003_g1463 [Phytophthora fragariae]KAE8944987.1 hypothetical protein PF009_g5357 [Phytophthora fragariae]KAE9021413.1 hypothetical protein PF011_g4955 [Phytophthora fragariae]KAE9125888.1 hypothetical protein PF010_g5458 [Phytophthora fragariae]KAE9129494.1 hypothetical protein PF007_g4868 [Phytophthora fragariae]
MIQHLISGREYDVHASRLKYYADSELNRTEEILELVSRQGMVLGVEDIRDHRFNAALDRWELFVSWMGLQAIEDSWEPLAVLAQDAPPKFENTSMPAMTTICASRLNNAPRITELWGHCRRIMIKLKLLRSVNIPFRQIAAHLVCLAAYQGSLDGLSKIYWIKARGKSF